jgi:uncharacterized protein YfdQ (DUF2303 family)
MNTTTPPPSDTTTPPPSDTTKPRPENIAETLARVLPEAKVIHTDEDDNGGTVTHVLVPKTFELKSLDNEQLLPHPRRTTATAKLLDAASFLAYVNAHAGQETAVWCDFDPVSYALAFTAVIDEHAAHLPGWRAHRAVFTPRPSVEWATWVKASNGKERGQVEFAEFLEANEKDIAAGPGLPSGLDMMKMATAFEANAEKRFKSKVRLQSGGVALEYVDNDTEATIEQMKLFERFKIGIPVFWDLRDADTALQAWPIEARLKYKTSQAKVTFWYQLIRPDMVHEAAARDMIERVRKGLDAVPLRMGECT